MKRIIFGVGCAVLLQACATATIEKLNTKDAGVMPQNADAKIYISLPKDGVYQNVKYEYSGQQVQQSLLDAFSRYNDDVVLGTEIQNLEDARKTAREMHAQLLVYPVIGHWEDRNTPWSGLRDKIRINIQIYDTQNNRNIDKTSLYATNRWFAFVNAAPGNLLKKVVFPYVSRLYE